MSTAEHDYPDEWLMEPSGMGGAAAAAMSDPRPRPWEEEGVAEVEKAVKDAEAGADHQPHEGELVKIKVATPTKDEEAWIHARYDAITRQNRDVVSVVPGGEADGQAKLECVACGTKKTPLWRNIESRAYCNACGLRKMRAMKSLLGPKKKRGRPKKISLPGEKLLAKAKKPAGRKRKRKPDKVVDVEDVVTGARDSGVRRGTRKRKESVWLHGGGIYVDPLQLSSPPNARAGARGGSTESKYVSRACQALNGFRKDAPQITDSSDDDTDVSLSDGELDLIFKLHEVYGGHRGSLFEMSCRKTGTGTQRLAILIRGARRLAQASQITQEEKLWLLNRISNEESYLLALPLATASYQELCEHLLAYVRMARQAEGEAEGEASPSLEEKAEKEAGNFPARCTPPPPLCDLGKGTVGQALALVTPTPEESRPLTPF